LESIFDHSGSEKSPARFHGNGRGGSLTYLAGAW